MNGHLGAKPITPRHVHRLRYFTGAYPLPTSLLVEGKGIRLTNDPAKTALYAPEDVPGLLAYLGPGWSAEPPVERMGT